MALIQSYREKIEKELADICADVINILRTHLIPKAGSPESKVFYHKMYARPPLPYAPPLRPGRTA